MLIWILFPTQIPGMRFMLPIWNYGGISQRAIVVWSEEIKMRNEQTFDKMIRKETDATLKDLKKLMSEKFACVLDAENEAKIWASAHPHHSLKGSSLSSVDVTGGTTPLGCQPSHLDGVVSYLLADFLIQAPDPIS
jgi:hypothetical protein